MPTRHDPRHDLPFSRMIQDLILVGAWSSSVFDKCFSGKFENHRIYDLRHSTLAIVSILGTNPLRLSPSLLQHCVRQPLPLIFPCQLSKVVDAASTHLPQHRVEKSVKVLRNCSLSHICCSNSSTIYPCSELFGHALGILQMRSSSSIGMESILLRA